MRKFVTISFALLFALAAHAGSVNNAATGSPLAPIGTFTQNNCLKSGDTQGSPQDAGAPCGSGSGTVTSVSSPNSTITIGSPTTTPTMDVVYGTAANTSAQGNDSRILNNVSVLSNWYAVTSATYGAKCDGSTDDGTAIDAAFTAAGATGGTIVFPAGTCKDSHQHTLTNDGASPPHQRPIRIIGAGAHMNGAGTATPYGGTIWDMSSAGTPAKILSLGLGELEISGITVYDSGTNTNAYIQIANTTSHIHDNAFIGNPSKSGTTSNQDAIILGGTSTTIDGSTNAAFQGYGTVIRDNFFDRVQRAIYCRVYCNGNSFIANTVWNHSGSALSGGAAIELDGAAGAATGNYIVGNLIETTNYPYGIKVTTGNYNFISGNPGFDASGSTLATVRVETSQLSNTVIGMQAPGGTAHYLSDAGTGTRYASSEAGQPSLWGPTTFRDESGVSTLIPRVRFNGGPAQTIIQPDATQTSGQIMLEGLRSSSEGTNPSGTFFSLTYGGTLTLGDGSGTTGAVFSNFGKTWTGAVGAGTGGNMIINSGTGGSGLRLQNNNTTIETNTGTVQMKFGAANGFQADGAAIAFGSAGDAIISRKAADTIVMSRSTNAQTFEIANTYTSGTNYEIGGLHWTGNTLQIDTEVGSSGTKRDVVLAPATGHWASHGTAPTVGSGSSDCGTTPAIAGNDHVARITVGSSTNGGKCTVTFANTGTWANSPICVCNDETTATACQAVPSTTASVALKGSFVAGDSIGMICQVYE